MEGTALEKLGKEYHASSVCCHQRRNVEIKDCHPRTIAVSVSQLVYHKFSDQLIHLTSWLFLFNDSDCLNV